MHEELYSVVEIVVQNLQTVGQVLLVSLIGFFFFELGHVEVQRLVILNCPLQILLLVHREGQRILFSLSLQHQVLTLNLNWSSLLAGSGGLCRRDRFKEFYTSSSETKLILTYWGLCGSFTAQ